MTILIIRLFMRIHWQLQEYHKEVTAWRIILRASKISHPMTTLPLLLEDQVLELHVHLFIYLFI